MNRPESHDSSRGRDVNRLLLSAAADLAALAVGVWLLADVRTPAPGGLTGPATTGSAPRVSVIIPARDEQAALPGLLDSLSAQSAPPVEVVVVDDHSSDATSAVALAGGARVLGAPPLPEGWLGKPWACHCGAEIAVGDLLVFLDADVVLAPDALARIVAEWASSSGLVSVQPRHEPLRAYEQLSAVCNLVAMMGTGAFSGPPRSEPTMAFGPCLAVGADLYRRSGGHADPRVRDRVTEDVALARRVRAAGGAVRVLAGGDLVGFRMYPAGPGQLVEGWSKMLATGAADAPRLAALATSIWVAGGLRVSARGLRALVGGRDRPAERAVDAGVYLAWALCTRAMLARVGRFADWTHWAFPVPLAAFVALAARSAGLQLSGRTATWRGRAVQVR